MDKTPYTWERERGIRLKKPKPVVVETARTQVNDHDLETQLPWYWSQVQEILKRVTKEVHESEKRSRFREVFLEVGTRPGFSVDVRKAFHKNIDSVSCELQELFSPKELSILQGFVMALVFWKVRLDWMNTYEIVDIFPDRVEISYSGARHAV